MPNAIPYILVLVGCATLIMALASLFTPKAALFFRQKTRLRGFSAWIGITLLCLIGIGLTAPHNDAPGKPVKAASWASSRPGAKAKPAPAPQAQAAVPESGHQQPSPASRPESEAASAPSVARLLPTVSLEDEKSTPSSRQAPLQTSPAPQKTASPKSPTWKNAQEPKKQASRPKREVVQTAQYAAGGKFHGNVKSFKYHNSGCEHFNCRNCVKVFKSRDEAQAAGYDACKRCGG